jgi:hypothetical protein
MSALCQKQTFRTAAETLFDHLVSKLLQLGRHIETECLRSFEVEDQFKPRRCLYWQFGGMLAAKNAVHVNGRTSKRFKSIITIG